MEDPASMLETSILDKTGYRDLDCWTVSSWIDHWLRLRLTLGTENVLIIILFDLQQTGGWYALIAMPTGLVT